MKKKFLTVLVVAVVAIATLALVACGGDGNANKATVKVVDAQITALTEVKAGQSDAAIIDSTMAGYLLNNGSDFSDLAIANVSDLVTEKEYYGVAAKKGKTKLIAFINNEMKKAQAEGGKYGELLTKYGLTARKVDITDTFTVADDWKSELNTAGKVVIGYTINAPMGIKNDDNTVTGFDIDLARAIFEPAGIAVETKLINWDSKTVDLNAGKIDLVWNGLTINAERLETMEISAKYLVNEQAVVVKKANVDSIKKVADLAGKKVAVEADSAGLDAAEAINATLAK